LCNGRLGFDVIDLLAHVGGATSRVGGDTHKAAHAGFDDHCSSLSVALKALIAFMGRARCERTKAGSIISAPGVEFSPGYTARPPLSTLCLNYELSPALSHSRQLDRSRYGGF